MSTHTNGASRVVPLDAFRGLTVIAMLLVNNASLGAATPIQLTHAAFGAAIHFADLVFPWFLLASGVSIPFSYAKAKTQGGSSSGFMLRAIRRGTTLVLLGILVDSAVARRLTPGLGVLQIIGLAYVVGALAAPLRMRARSLLAVMLLAVYWALLKWPNPLAEAPFPTIAFLNAEVLNPVGLRGLLSVLPTSALVLLGSLLGGRVLVRTEANAFLWLSGSVLVSLGLLLTLDHPMSKQFWTPSYIVFTGGLGFLAIAACSVLVAIRRGLLSPFVAAGSSPIFAYLAPIFVKVGVLQTWRLPNSEVTIEAGMRQALLQYSATWGGWLYTVGFIATWWIALGWLYRKRVYIRI